MLIRIAVITLLLLLLYVDTSMLCWILYSNVADALGPTVAQGAGCCDNIFYTCDSFGPVCCAEFIRRFVGYVVYTVCQTAPLLIGYLSYKVLYIK